MISKNFFKVILKYFLKPAGFSPTAQAIKTWN